MMALLYAVQGSFWPLLAVHLRDLGIDGRGRGWIFATLALGSFAMPLGAGHLVDRLMPSQRFLALIYALGTGILVALALGVTATPASLFGLFLVYWLITAPATGISTSLALRNLARPREEFGGVRLWGTAGWMVVGWLVSLVMACSGSSRAGHGAFEAFWVSAGLSVVLAGYCLTLPNTPPLAVGVQESSGLREAISLMRRPDVAVFLTSAFGVFLTTPFVYQVLPTYLESRGLPRPWIPTAMTLGQMPEIATLALFPWMFRRFAFRGTLALGIAAWIVRYVSLALDPPLWVAVAGIPLHGVAVGCFSVGGQVFLDSRAPAHRRAGTQALLMVLTLGMGSLLGSLLAGQCVDLVGSDSARVFLVPCVINVALLIYFCAGFRPETVTMVRVGTVDRLPPLPNDGVRGTVARVGNLVTESADG
jgi:MFS family permease